MDEFLFQLSSLLSGQNWEWRTFLDEKKTKKKDEKKKRIKKKNAKKRKEKKVIIQKRKLKEKFQAVN
jgi:hypothetical protein